MPNAAFNGGAQTMNIAGVNMRIPGMRFAFRPMVLDNTRAMSRYASAMIDTVEKSPDLPSFKSNFGDPIPEAAKSPTRYQLAMIMIPSLSRAPEAHYRALAHRRLAATCLAIRLYTVDRGGKLPDTLQDLVPSYIPSVPLDPLAAGQPLRYVNPTTDALQPRVYSIGINGVDDGGNAAEYRNQARRLPLDDVRDVRPPQ
jgi:hypothetical protein